VGQPIKGKLDHPAGAQAKQAHKRDDRKAATGLLVACIRPLFAVLRRVGHADARAIDDAHDAAGKQGQMPVASALDPPAHGFEDGAQGVGAQAIPGLAISAGAIARYGLAQSGSPGLNAGQGIAAGGVSSENLGEKSPENDQSGEVAVSVLGGIGEELFWEKASGQTAESVELAGGIFEAPGGGARGAAAEETGESF
jgi:hypothetical protein